LLLFSVVQSNLLLRPWVLLHFPTSLQSITFQPVLPTICPSTSLLLALLLNVVGCGFSTESHSPPLTACEEEEEPDASAEHDVNVAEPSNVKPPE